jgi:hypothetical protein
MVLHIVGHSRRAASRAVGSRLPQVGFTVGPAPPAMRFSAVAATELPTGGREWSMAADWVPCAAEVGSRTLCLEAADATRYSNGSFVLAPGPDGAPVKVKSATSPAQASTPAPASRRPR